MTFLAPVALLGLGILPVLWWLHRRARRPPVLDVPSLLFLEEEARPESARVARRLDLELVLVLATALSLVLAAAGPGVRLGEPGRTVRVVVLPPAWAGTDAYRKGLETTLGALRERLAASDRLDLVPPSDAPARPTDAALLAAARAGSASLRIVVSDRLPSRVPADVRWVAHGLPDARNLGIVAATLEPRGPGVRVFVNVANEGPEPVSATLLARAGPADAPGGARRDLVVPAQGWATASLDLPDSPESVHVLLEAPPDAVPDDGTVWFRRTPLSVRFDPGLPPATRRAVEEGLRVVLGEAGLEHVSQQADLVVGPSDMPAGPLAPAFRVGAVAAGAAGAPAPEGVDVAADDPLAQDLSTVGADLVYPPGAGGVPEGAEVAFARRSGRVLHPVLLRRGPVVDLVPDPLAGGVPLVRTPFWPLLLDNLLRECLGAPAEGGYRAVRSPDPELVHVGRDVRPFDPSWLAAARPDRPAPARPLAPWFAAAAGAGLLLLWGLPPGSNRRARLGRAPVGS